MCRWTRCQVEQHLHVAICSRCYLLCCCCMVFSHQWDGFGQVLRWSIVSCSCDRMLRFRSVQGEHLKLYSIVSIICVCKFDHIMATCSVRFPIFLKVFSIDYGNCWNVHINHIYKWANCLNEIPSMAFLCRLDHVKKVMEYDYIARNYMIKTLQEIPMKAKIKWVCWIDWHLLNLLYVLF